MHNYQKVIYKNIYPNIDLEFQFSSQNELERPLEYQFIIHPGGNPAEIKLKYYGADTVNLVNNQLEIKVTNGRLIENVPKSYFKDTKKAIEVNYKSIDTNTFGFRVPEGLKIKSDLIIDPVPNLEWGTYFGGQKLPFPYSGYTASFAIAVDSNQNVYICGNTDCTSGIATTGAYLSSDTGLGGDSAYGGFISKFNASGSALIWGTYCDVVGSAITLDTHDNVYITGQTKRWRGLATIGAYQTNYGGGSYDAFVAKFNSTGTKRLWETYYGGPGSDVGHGIDVDSINNVYITGWTSSSSGISILGAYQTAFGGGDDAFIAKFDSSGSSLVWATYYGGTNIDGAIGIALDKFTNVYITGQTMSTTGIATIGAYQTTFAGGPSTGDAFVAKFNPTGTSLLWGTYYGGPGDESGLGIVLDDNNDSYVTGVTNSISGIATPGAHQTTFGGSNQDAFVAKFNPAGSSILWGTYYGGPGNEYGDALVIDNCHNVYITGYTNSSSGISTSGAFQSNYKNGDDAFVAKFNPNGSNLVWGTYYGGAFMAIAWGIAIDKESDIYITGQTENSSGMTTTGAYVTTYTSADSMEAFVAKFDSAAPQFNVKPLNTTLCLGKSVTINSTGGTGYTWFPSTGLSCMACPNPTATPTATTIYEVVTTSNGCADTAQVYILVITPPNVIVDTPALVCSGSPVLLQASGSGSGPITYQWSPGGQTTDTITVNPSSTTIYTIAVSNGCTSTNTVTVTPDNPSMIACCNATISIGNDTTLVANGSYIKNYQWQPTVVCLNPPLCDSVKATPTITTTYTVTGTDTMGCQIKRQLTIIVEPPCFNFIVPNVFTPDYSGPNGVNNEFYIKTEGISDWSIIIYDRWGNEMFKTTNPDSYWTGVTESGGNAPDGVYYYILSGNCQGTTYKKDGFLQLIR